MERDVIEIAGPDAAHFLHGLVTRDVPETGLGYAALLSPQGKYLADFLTFRTGDALCLDVDVALAAGLRRRLGLYRLRSKVEIGGGVRAVGRGTGPAPEGARTDPRPGMGWRTYGGGPGAATDWDAVRVENLVPEAGIELIPEESYVLEMGFERLGGVDFRKGCYVGQEIVARMKHKTELRKGLARVSGPGLVAGAAIVAGGRAVGTVHTVSGGRALAYLRFDRADGMETAGGPVALDARGV